MDGSPIEFYINGFKAECAVPGGPWQSSFPFQSQAVTELNLKVHLFYVFLPLSPPVTLRRRSSLRR